MLLNFSPLFNADDDGGTAGDSPEGKVKPSDILNRYGNTTDSLVRMAEQLAKSENANWRVRDNNRKLTEERDVLLTRVPADGGRVLSKEESAAYDAYVALGKPDDVQAAISANGEATAKLAKLERQAQIRAAAEASGLKAAVLERLAGDLPIEVRDVDGKPVAFAKDDKGEKPLTEYAASVWSDFLPSLQVQPDAPRNTAFIQQHGGGTPAGDKAAQFIEQQAAKRAAQPNPLMKQGA